LRAEVVAASVAAAHNQVLRHWLRSDGASDPFPELEEALRYVTDTFDSTQPTDRKAASNEVIVLAFPSSTPTEELVAELTKARAPRVQKTPAPKTQRGRS
jgi:hypothetical protein